MAKYKKLYKSKDKWIGGVCAGLAEYFKIDPLIVRVLWILFTLIYGIGILVYILMWIIVPKKK